MDQVGKGVRVERDMLGRRAVAVEHGGKLSGGTQRVRAGRAELFAALDGEL